MKKYKIERIGSAYNPLYTLTAYSNNKPIKFLLDSGCSTNAILPQALKKCAKIKTEASTENTFGNGDSIIQNLWILEITLEPNSPLTYDLVFSEMASKTRKIMKSIGCIGILGAQFMQCCRIDFRNLWLDVAEVSGARSVLRLVACEILKNAQQDD